MKGPCELSGVSGGEGQMSVAAIEKVSWHDRIYGVQNASQSLAASLVALPT